MPAGPLPTGTVTFLFTDIEGSTKLWEAHPAEMRLALARHDAVVREAIESAGGCVFKTVGDAFCAAFTTAHKAVRSALAAQLALASEPWPEATPIRVRMALHTGVAECRDGDYFGACVNRVARLLSSGHGGQSLLSQTTRELVLESLPKHAGLVDLGLHRFKDLASAETVWQLQHPSLPREFPPLNSLRNQSTNLPLQMTSFIGREKEMAEVESLLEKTRLLTLTGSGGCGKTRLSLQAAVEVLNRFQDGIWFIELAPLSDPRLVTQSVAEVLSIREGSGEPILKTLLNSLKDKQMLLLLDNCEHLLEASARLADAVLRGCPKVKVFASSREGLGIAGETTYRVPSLSVPDLKQPQTPERVSNCESVRLFIERATAVKTDFSVTPLNASALARVCYRLDGIPLALELAAARVRNMPVEQIETRLDGRFRLLTGGSRTALPRQQTLRALIDWSYDLLNGQEKRLLNRLSVFHGGWRLESAECVCSGEGIEASEILDLLSSLHDKSLVIYEEHEGTARYRLLETVRQYACDRLVESGEREAVLKRHRDSFLALVEEAEPKLTGPEQVDWYRRLDEEHDNLRAALDWSLSEAGAMESLRLCGSVWRFWYTRGLLSEGRDWCKRAVQQRGAEKRTAERAKVLFANGYLACVQADYETSRTCCEEGLSIRREIGDSRGVAASLNGLGILARAECDYVRARIYYEEGLAIFREIGERRGVSLALGNLGSLAADQGDNAAARTHFEEALAILKDLGDRINVGVTLNNLGIATRYLGDCSAAMAYSDESLAIFKDLGYPEGIDAALSNLGSVAEKHGDYAKARACWEECLVICREVGDRRRTAEHLESFARLCLKQNMLEDAAILSGAADTLRVQIGAPLAPTDREQYDLSVATARQALGEDAFTAAWAKGQAMTLDEAIDLALTAPKA